MKTKKPLQWLCLGILGFLTCVGCAPRLNRPPTIEEEIMVKETLEETSPRAENNQPKAIPEFKFRFGGPCRRGVAFPAREKQSEVSDRDIRLENN